ncbi:unnamed protein product [Prorocentrum cordatum]|uniref:Uncharacterized protein n=1 Tax=Prorocentrum cordatum TaxID=2364126 RepID=A0ABN9QV81_9DINO|nr:unnamed protein product [Polarella glacialis]
MSEFVGSKTTVHFTDGVLYPTYDTYHVPGADVVMSLFTDLGPTILSSGMDAAEVNSLAKHGSQTMRFLKDPSTGWIEKSAIERLKKLLGLNGVKHPTSGMLAIDHFVNMPNVRLPVYIHGFDFFQGPKMHYFDEHEPIYERVNDRIGVNMHSPAKEKVSLSGYVEKLVAEGKVRFLRRDARAIALDAARGSALAVHAAAGLTGGAGELAAARLLCAADGIIRSAVALLAAPVPPPAQAQAPMGPRRRRRPRGRGGKREAGQPLADKMELSDGMAAAEQCGLEDTAPSAAATLAPGVEVEATADGGGADAGAARAGLELVHAPAAAADGDGDDRMSIPEDEWADSVQRRARPPPQLLVPAALPALPVGARVRVTEGACARATAVVLLDMEDGLVAITLEDNVEVAFKVPRGALELLALIGELQRQDLGFFSRREHAWAPSPQQAFGASGAPAGAGRQALGRESAKEQGPREAGRLLERLRACHGQRSLDPYWGHRFWASARELERRGLEPGVLDALCKGGYAGPQTLTPPALDELLEDLGCIAFPGGGPAAPAPVPVAPAEAPGCGAPLGGAAAPAPAPGTSAGRAEPERAGGGQRPRALAAQDQVEEQASAGDEVAARALGLLGRLPPQRRGAATWAMLHRLALQHGRERYEDPSTGLSVFTSAFLRGRKCCGYTCRHCPHRFDSTVAHGALAAAANDW